jgi:hypothetical protein
MANGGDETINLTLSRNDEILLIIITIKWKHKLIYFMILSIVYYNQTHSLLSLENRAKKLHSLKHTKVAN